MNGYGIVLEKKSIFYNSGISRINSEIMICVAVDFYIFGKNVIKNKKSTADQIIIQEFIQEISEL